MALITAPAPRQELILVASLIDKAANVAGLTRTCEVMRRAAPAQVHELRSCDAKTRWTNA